MRQMHFVAFMQAQNCTTIPASWRHPDARTDTYSPDYYQHIARVLEAGKFDLAFFDDRLAMPDLYSGDHAHTVQNGIRCVKMDPLACLMPMAMATTRLGLGATMSTTYYEPFHVARAFATFDLRTKGRGAWTLGFPPLADAYPSQREKDRQLSFQSSAQVRSRNRIRCGSCSAKPNFPFSLRRT